MGTNLTNPSFAEVAKAMGGGGIVVDSADQVGDALIEAADSGKAGVLEIMVNQELGDPFRRDALNRPVRLLDKYKAYGT